MTLDVDVVTVGGGSTAIDRHRALLPGDAVPVTGGRPEPA